MKRKVVFFTLVIVPRCHKRIEEFIDNGYEVEVYSIGNNNDLNGKISDYKLITIGLKINIPYFLRLFSYTSELVKIIKRYDRNKTLFYFFSLNVAVPALISKKLKYIYEESDMLFDRSKFFFFRYAIKQINIYIIRKSLLTIFTSEGFGRYYFGNNLPKNISYITNKVSPRCLKLPKYERLPIDIKNIKFGFVGYIRYDTLLNFAKVVINNFHNHEFHFFGENNFFSNTQIEQISNSGKVFFHGKFKNPDDLSFIYSRIDFLVVTYDTKGINPRFAEPNKIYESIFFKVPIIVSNNSYLAYKVDNLKIGFSVDPWNNSEIIDRIRNITLNQYNFYMRNLRIIPKNEVINDNKEFFIRINELLNSV